jgi:thymidine phosphorylase
MTTLSKSRTLASSIVSVANGAGMPTRAIITDMNQPLTRSAGNALEVAEAIDYLTGTRREPRLHEVTMALCSEMLVLAKLAPSLAKARAMLERVLDTGEAAAIFGTMVAVLGGPKRLIEQPWKHLEAAPLQVAVTPTTPGIVTAIDTRAVGMVVVSLGGGRTRPQDSVDHAVGLTQLAAVGERVDTDRPLGVVHARTRQQVDSATQLLRAAYKVGRAAPAHTSASAVIERITA